MNLTASSAESLKVVKAACSAFQLSLRFTCPQTDIAMVTAFCNYELMFYAAYTYTGVCLFIFLSCTIYILMTEKAIESGLSEEIKYLSQVSTVHPHEGSIYGAEKVT